jgi:hypothetical protein
VSVASLLEPSTAGSRTPNSTGLTVPRGVRRSDNLRPDPEFDRAYRAARRQAFGQSTARLQYGASAAASTLLKVMLDPGTPASTKVRAAECVLSHAAKAIEIEDIDARVAALEQAAASSTPRR